MCSECLWPLWKCFSIVIELLQPPIKWVLRSFIGCLFQCIRCVIRVCPFFLEGAWRWFVGIIHQNLKKDLEQHGDLQHPKQDLEQQLRQWQVENARKEAEMERLRVEREDMNNRLSKMASERMREGNPTVEDLNDPRRPTALVSRWTSLFRCGEYWTAYSNLASEIGEAAAAPTLLAVCKVTYEATKDYVRDLVEALTAELGLPEQSGSHSQTAAGADLQAKDLGRFFPDEAERESVLRSLRSQAPGLQSGQAGQSPKSGAVVSRLLKSRPPPPSLAQKLDGIFRQNVDIDPSLFRSFADQLMELIYYMRAQEIPMVVDLRGIEGMTFDPSLYEPDSSSVVANPRDTLIKIIFRPPLLRHESGPVLSKGEVEVVPRSSWREKSGVKGSKSAQVTRRPVSTTGSTMEKALPGPQRSVPDVARLDDQGSRPNADSAEPRKSRVESETRVPTTSGLQGEAGDTKPNQEPQTLQEPAGPEGSSATDTSNPSVGHNENEDAEAESVQKSGSLHTSPTSPGGASHDPQSNPSPAYEDSSHNPSGTSHLEDEVTEYGKLPETDAINQSVEQSPMADDEPENGGGMKGKYTTWTTGVKLGQDPASETIPTDSNPTESSPEASHSTGNLLATDLGRPSDAQDQNVETEADRAGLAGSMHAASFTEESTGLHPASKTPPMVEEPRDQTAANYGNHPETDSSTESAVHCKIEDAEAASTKEAGGNGTAPAPHRSHGCKAPSKLTSAGEESSAPVKPSTAVQRSQFIAESQTLDLDPDSKGPTENTELLRGGNTAHNPASKLPPESDETTDDPAEASRPEESPGPDQLSD